MNRGKVYITIAAAMSMLFIGMSYTIGAEIGKDKLPSYYDADVNDDGDLAYNESSAPESDEANVAERLSAPLVKIENTPMPDSFCGTAENHLSDGEYLNATFRKIAERKEVVRILQIGDSHVRGHYFPMAVRKTLEESLGSQATVDDKVTYNTDCIATETGNPGVVFSAIGINGACALRFIDDDMIQQIEEQRPDMVIVSFGTNESHGSFEETDHIMILETLLARIREVCPEATFLLTTPPGSYVKERGRSYRDRRGRRRYTSMSHINEKTVRVAENIIMFGKEHHVAVWDMYSIAGGEKYACTNWCNAGLMTNDQIHFTANGYQLQGHLLGEAILKAYNDYLRM